MKASRRYAAVGAAAFVVFLVAAAPARLLQALAPAGIRLHDPRGSVWSGTAAAVDAGSLRLGETHWRLVPWALLLGRLAADADTSLAVGKARGRLALGIGGEIRCDDCSLTTTLDYLATIIGTGLPISRGKLSVDMQELRVRDGWPTRAIGELRLREVPLVYRDGKADPAQFASFELQLDAGEIAPGNAIEGRLTDEGGPVELTGTLRLSPPRNYELSGRAATRPGAPAEMGQALAMLGPASPGGGHEFSFAGSF